MASTSPMFRRSSFCSGSGCVEVAGLGPEQILVRGTDGANRRALTFPLAQWQAFVGGIKRGDFRPLR